MNLIPIKTEYNFEVMKHTARALLEHIDGNRKASYFFDDKLVSERVVPDGDVMTDDDCIADMLSEYSKNNTGVYADLYSKHADKIHLINKIVSVKVEEGPILVSLDVKCEKNSYTFSLVTNGGKDKIACKMEAADFSEAYEKARLLLHGMENMNSEISKHINEFTNDQIREIIKWS